MARLDPSAGNEPRLASRTRSFIEVELFAAVSSEGNPVVS